MAKRKPTKFEAEYDRAKANLKRLRREIADNNADVEYSISSYLDTIMPMLPDMQVGFEEASKLYGTSEALFATRADYERAYRYLKRINSAAETEWESDDTYPISGVRTSLTSMLGSESGYANTTEFMRHESVLATNLRNRRARERLEKQGINMVQKNVYNLDVETGEVRIVYDKNRHPIKMWVPETPEQERKYYYSVQKDRSLRVENPTVDVPEAVISKWGDVVPVYSEAPVKEVKPENIVRDIVQDQFYFARVDNYLGNLREAMSDTLPDEIAQMYDELFDDIDELTPEQRMSIADSLSDMDGINALDLWYKDRVASMASKMAEINRGLKESIEEALEADDYEILEYDNMEETTDLLGDYDDTLSWR